MLGLVIGMGRLTGREGRLGHNRSAEGQLGGKKAYG